MKECLNKKENVDYKKYRWFITSSEKLVIGGKNEKQNEELVKNAKKNSVVIHTREPGSPFVIIDNPNARELKEAAIFCAKYSQAWKKLGKRDITVHWFLAKDIFKTAEMKQGTFGVKKFKQIKIKKEEIE